MDVVILTPVFNDWDCLVCLLKDLDAQEFPSGTNVQVLVVDDGSVAPMPNNPLLASGCRRIHLLTVLQLTCNLGHQRAIGLGIAAIAAGQACDLVVVMDSDGEDSAEDVLRLIQRWQSRPDAVVVAQRVKRQEGAGFRLGYAAYKALFRVLVGRSISFGNFCAFGQSVARRLASTPETWNHLAASLLRSRLPIVAVPTNRGRRYLGTPSTGAMLLTHGLSALAVFSDRVFTRLLFASGLLGGLAVLGMFIVICIRLLTNLGVPGWATTAVGALAIMIVQAVMVCLIASVLLLASRSQASAIPARLLDVFVRERRVFKTGAH
jgi:polyisoprenyl-phosphate glycosyltransferase